MDGILLINKEAGCTSRDVVNEIGHLLHTKKVGHTGTLDPMAKGVLIVCVGKATKIAELITATEKEYIATVELGTETDTLDSMGSILKEQEAILSEEEIKKALERMKKTYEQEVPIYSAVKVNGKKLYEYARNKEQVELPKKEVTIHEIELLGHPTVQNGKTIFQFKTLVSKGTYIRSLIRDLATELHTIGIMTDLTRTKQGIWKIEDTITLEDLKKEEIPFHPMKDFLQDYKQVIASPFLEQKIRNGQLLENRDQTDILFLDSKENLLALYKPYEKDPTKIKPWKMF